MPADVTKTPVPAAITTPSTVEAGIGTLEFTDGYPTSQTAETLRDHLDYLHGVETFIVYISPTRPDGVAAGNWIQSDPERGWFVLLRLYSPLQPFFDKSWRPGEFEPVT